MIFGIVAFSTTIAALLLSVVTDRASNFMNITFLRRGIVFLLSIMVVLMFICIISLGCDTDTILLCICTLVMFASSTSSK